MLRHVGAVSIIVLLCVPLVLSAAGQCPAPARTLSFGARGDDVVLLQRFLISEGDLLSDSATGYFGPLTQQAVREWQKSKRIITSADDPGAGVVGPKTRAAIATRCSGSTAQATNNYNGGFPYFTAATSTQGNDEGIVGKCPIVRRPATGCVTSWQGMRGKNGCVGSWYCVRILSTASQALSATSTITGNHAPVINSVAGPTSLAVGAEGSWKIFATDADGDTLLYSFAWGETSSAFDTILSFAQNFAGTSTSAHTYTAAGLYTPTFTAKDTMGNTAQTSLSILVGSAAATDLDADSGSADTPSTGNTGSTGTDGTSYFCAAGGYWSQTPCPTSQGNTQPFGSYGGGSLGQACHLEGQQSFTACPFMANCFQGGTYLVCRSGVWTHL